MKRVMGWVASLIVAASVALTVAIVVHADPVHVYKQPDGVVADQVNCDQWERVDATRWRTESGAVYSAEYSTGGILGDATGVTVTVRHGSDVTEKDAFDLFWTLEVQCRKEPGF